MMFGSLRTKVIVLFLLAIIIPIVFVGTVGTIYYRDVVRQTISNNEQAQAQTLALLTSSYMDGAVSFLDNQSARPEFQDALIAEDVQRISTSIATISNSTLVYNWVYVTDSSGRVVSSFPYPNVVGENLSSNPMISQLLVNDTNIVGDPVYSNVTGKPEIFVGTSVLSPNGTIVGVLVGALDTDFYTNTIAEAKSSIPDTVFYVVNSTGSVLVDKNTSYMNEIADFSSVPPVQMMLAGKESGVAEYYNPVENTTRLGAFAQIPKYHWGVVIAVPVSSLYAPVDNVIIPFIAFIGLMSLLAVGVAYFFGRSLADPILAISSASNKIMDDESYRKRLPTGRKDEVGELARSFSDMVDNIKQGINERKKEAEAREQLMVQLEEKTHDLQKSYEELEVKSEELAAQTEEIECANEELRCTNDELQNLTRSLRETRDYLEKLIDNANAPIIVWDPNFIITRFNHAFERLSGFTAYEIIGKDLSILFPSDSREETMDKIGKTLKGEQWESVEIHILHKSGGISTVLWNSANIYAGDKSLLATIAQGQDITRRKKAEKELEDSKYQAELYLDLMGHDISNMHQIVMTQLELSRDILNIEGRLEGEDRELIDTSITTLVRAAKLIDNVRKLQKLSSHEYSLEAVDLSALVKDALDQYSIIPDRDITIKFSQDGKRMVRANALLKDVFGNLADNSVKHSSGSLTLAVSINKVGHNGKSYYRVAFEDNGHGIPDDKKEEIFQRFKRGQTTARGTGLGLYLVKTLVEGFGGYVEVQNRILEDYTKGTRFLIYLPAFEEN